MRKVNLEENTNTVDLNAFLHNNPVSMQELSSTDIINQILNMQI